MDLFVNPMTETVHRVDGSPVILGRLYDIPGREGYKFVVHPQKTIGMVIVVRGRNYSQRSVVRFLGASAGRDQRGKSIPARYPITLDPPNSIFPIEKLVKRLIGLDVDESRICPMYDATLSDWAPNESRATMYSDGRVRTVQSAVEGRDGWRFDVSRASWAVLTSDETTVRRVYLWMGAAKSEQSSKLIKAIRQINLRRRRVS